MTIKEADNQAKELIRLIRESNVKATKIGEMNIVDVDKFLDVHECRMEFLTTFSREWKIHYLRLYVLKKRLTFEAEKNVQ